MPSALCIRGAKLPCVQASQKIFCVIVCPFQRYLWNIIGLIKTERLLGQRASRGQYDQRISLDRWQWPKIITPHILTPLIQRVIRNHKEEKFRSINCRHETVSESRTFRSGGAALRTRRFGQGGSYSDDIGKFCRQSCFRGKSIIPNWSGMGSRTNTYTPCGPNIEYPQASVVC